MSERFSLGMLNHVCEDLNLWETLTIFLCRSSCFFLTYESGDNRDANCKTVMSNAQFLSEKFQVLLNAPRLLTGVFFIYNCIVSLDIDNPFIYNRSKSFKVSISGEQRCFNG